MSLVSSFFGTRCISHTRTVVRECGKDDDQCQWERLKFDPPPPLNPLPIVTKIYLLDYVVDIYHPAKFHPDRFRGLGVAGGQILAFPIDIDRRPYNTLALPCECVI